MLEIEIDGKRRKSRRQHGDGRRAAGWGLHSAFLLSQETFHRRQLPYVSGAGGKGAQTLPACATPVTNGMKVFTHSEWR